MLVLVTGLQGTGKSTIAERCGEVLGAPVFGWDWGMAALTPFEILQRAMRALDVETYRRVGWALVFQSARAQLRRGMPVVLDGMARAQEITEARNLARENGVSSLVVLTMCEDLRVQRARIEGRRRDIPGWHELTWDQVERSRAAWVPPTDVDLTVDSTAALDECVALVTQALARPQAEDPSR